MQQNNYETMKKLHGEILSKTLDQLGIIKADFRKEYVGKYFIGETVFDSWFAGYRLPQSVNKRQLYEEMELTINRFHKKAAGARLGKYLFSELNKLGDEYIIQNFEDYPLGERLTLVLNSIHNKAKRKQPPLMSHNDDSAVTNESSPYQETSEPSVPSVE